MSRDMCRMLLKGHLRSPLSSTAMRSSHLQMNAARPQVCGCPMPISSQGNSCHHPAVSAQRGSICTCPPKLADQSSSSHRACMHLTWSAWENGTLRVKSALNAAQTWPGCQSRCCLLDVRSMDRAPSLASCAGASARRSKPCQAAAGGMVSPSRALIMMQRVPLRSPQPCS